MRALACLLALTMVTPARADVGECVGAAESSQVLRAEGKLKAAREKLIVCAARSCPALVQTDCRRWLDEVEAQMPSLVFRVVDGKGSDVTDARVLVDGQKVADRLDGRAVVVDPGQRAIRFEVGGRTFDQTIVVRQGEHDRIVSTALPAETTR